MRGGTNFVPVPIKTHSGIRVYAGFPRTHLDGACGVNTIYRPELVILSAVGSNFHITYASDAIEFGHAVLDETALESPCKEGHILIPYSISRWDLSDGQDIMTLSISVADKTVQITRLHGLMKFIKQLPYFGEFLKHDVSQGGEALWNFRWSVVGNDVLACSAEAAGYSSFRNAIEAELRKNEVLRLMEIELEDKNDGDERIRVKDVEGEAEGEEEKKS